MKLKARMLLFTVLLAFTVIVVLFARAPVDNGAPTVTLVVTREMGETAVFPTPSPLANQIEDDGVQIPCDPNEHQELRETK